jgi:two-component system LytT family response regulator
MSRGSGAQWGVLVADDEPAARRGVRQLLDEYPEFTVVGECRNGFEALESLDRLRPHLLFLDIQMPGMTGFEVIRRRGSERMPVTVFLTAYDEFALKAFEAQALDYLVKPVSQPRFAATMKRVLKQLKGTERAVSAAIAVTTARGTTLIRLNEVDWIESSDNYARIWVGARSYLLRESLNALERRVRAHGFARAHRQALVRLGAVHELAKAPKGGVIAVLASGARVPVSRRKRAAFGRAVRA